MPFITQNFHHIMDANDIIKSGVNDYTEALALNNYCSKQASQLFFDDLKSILENMPGIDVTFSDTLTYETGLMAPFFRVFGLDFSPMVSVLCSYVDSYSLVPTIHRHYEYNPISYSFKYFSSSSKDMSAYVIPKARINKSTTEILELDYTIEVRYNDDFLLIEFRPYGDKTIKFTLCCLIKGVDINGKDVVYESGGCNTYSSGSPFEYAHHWVTYHKLVWCDHPKASPYTNAHSYPAYNTMLNFDRTLISNTVIFMDLVNNSVTPHTSKIELNGDINNSLLQKPICCWGRVNFSDNILTGAVTLTQDTDYEINGDTYYCPGDYITLASMQAGVNYSRYGGKFLLRI